MFVFFLAGDERASNVEVHRGDAGRFPLISKTKFVPPAKSWRGSAGLPSTTAPCADSARNRAVPGIVLTGRRRRSGERRHAEALVRGRRV